MKYLIVEDHEMYAELIAAVINAKDVRIATTMKQAIEMIDAQPPNFIVLDLSLPDSSSMDTMKKIRELKNMAHGASVVVVTGDDSPQTRLSALAQGADSLFVKGGGDEFFGLLAARLKGNREEPCASRDTVEQIEHTVFEMTGVRLEVPRLTVRALMHVLPLLQPAA